MTTTRRAWARAAAGETASGRSERAAAEDTQPPYRKIVVSAKSILTIIRARGLLPGTL
ncbi:hypothetical protein D3C77_235260 [compost metagenome]